MYSISRYTSFMKKDNIYAVYCNFNLYFFKGDTYKWFDEIVSSHNIDKIDKEFLNFLLDKEIIFLDGGKNV